MRAFGERTENVAAASGASYGLVRDDTGPVMVDNDPVAIVTGLRGELDRIRQTYESSCICVVSPDGDSAIKVMDAFGRRFAARLRSYDAIYRFADDKYLVMLPRVGRENAVAVIKRLRTQVIGEPFPVGGDAKAMVTASFGATIVDSTAPLHEHMDRASEAHDWALKGRGDSICMWTPQL